VLRRVLGRHRESKLGQHDEGVFNAWQRLHFGCSIAAQKREARLQQKAA